MNAQFGSNTLFQKALKDAFNDLVNRDVGKFKTADLVASFCDRLLKTGSTEKLSDNEVCDVVLCFWVVRVNGVVLCWMLCDFVLLVWFSCCMVLVSVLPLDNSQHLYFFYFEFSLPSVLVVNCFSFFLLLSTNDNRWRSTWRRQCSCFPTSPTRTFSPKYTETSKYMLFVCVVFLVWSVCQTFCFLFSRHFHVFLWIFQLESSVFPSF